jgi:hypothetical protein
MVNAKTAMSLTRVVRRALKARRAKSRLVRFIVRLHRGLRAPWKFCTDPTYRAVVRIRLRRPEDLQQTTVLTSLNRYPELFAAACEYLQRLPEPRVLSYGCATGEEVVSLRNYLPGAWIVGAEINPQSLQTARKRATDDRIQFVESDAARISALGPYDAIFCLAVLQRTPQRILEEGISSLERIYPFRKFDDKVKELDSWLKREGLLAIHHAQYRLADATVGHKYEPLKGAEAVQDGGPKFDRESQRLPDEAVCSVFTKVRD